MTARDQHRNQMPEDQHGPGYDNAVADDWRRGGGKGGATEKPGFDFGASYRRKDGGNDWNSTTQADKVSFVRPEPVTANKQQRRTGGWAMSNDAERVFQRALARLQLEEQSATSDYNAHLYNHDEDAASDAMVQIAQARQQRETLVQQWNAEIERNTHRQPWISDEQRAARTPSELDAQDLANLMNTSRYAGKGFSSDDYMRLRAGLAGYRAMRGTESK
jgi:hypothetical protein